MAQLRAKQIKLSNAGDLLIGGTNGNGTVLAKGGDNQVLKIVAGGLAYADNTASDITFTPTGSIAASTVQAAIAEVATDAASALSSAVSALESADTAIDGRLNALEGANLNTRLTTAEGDIDTLQTDVSTLETDLATEVTARTNADSALQSELDTTQTGAGLGTNGAYTAPAGSNYLGSATSLKDADSLLDSALKSLSDTVDTLGGATFTAIQNEIDAIELAVGLGTNGTLPGGLTGNLAGATSVLDAVAQVDDALTSDIADLQTQINSITGLDTLVFKGVLDGDTDATELAAIETTAQDGDVYRIATTGAATFADQTFDVNVGDFVAYVGSGTWVKFDNTDPTFSTTDNNLLVSGSTYAGFTIALQNKGTVSSANTAITVGGGASSVLSNVSLTFNAGNVGFETLGNVGTPEANKYLMWTGTELAYKTKAEIGVTVRAEEDFTPATAANASVTLANTPSGAISVFINGIKLKTTGYSVTGTSVTLVDSANGYGVETGDVVSVSYSYLA